MTTARPRIAAQLAAELIDAAPGRVRKRIDANPAAAEDWTWRLGEGRWEIVAGEETVTLRPSRAGELHRLEELSCSCLLSPKCFHLLACITTLAYADTTNPPATADEPAAGSSAEAEPLGEASGEAALPAGTGSEATTPLEGAEQGDAQVTAAMRVAAEQTLQTLERLLVVGCRSAGVMVQSALLRAGHGCRAEGLVNLAHAVVRIVEGIQRLRAQDEHTDSQQLQQDVSEAVRLAIELARAPQVPVARLGQVRRRFDPIAISRLVGIVAEPIWTLSGYAGVCIHLRANDGRLYQISDARPGDVALVQQAYAGGIDLGGTAVPASRLSRSLIAVQNLTASADGRLSKGTRTRWAIQQNPASVADDGFALPLRDQLEAVFGELPGEGAEPRGGWDLIAVEGMVLGAQGATVLLQCDAAARPLRLGVAIDDERLHFRRNLQWLARCPGLRLRVYGRVRPEISGRIDPLTIVPLLPDKLPAESAERLDDIGPQLELPAAWEQRCHLGLDELQRHYFTASERFAEEVVLPADEQAAGQGGADADVALTAALERQLTALVLGGRNCVPPITSAAHRRQRERLLARYQSTAARLLETLAASSARGEAAVATASTALPLTIVFAAMQRYCDSAKQSGQRDRWLQWLDADERS